MKPQPESAKTFEMLFDKVMMFFLTLNLLSCLKLTDI